MLCKYAPNCLSLKITWTMRILWTAVQYITMSQNQPQMLTTVLSVLSPSQDEEGSNCPQLPPLLPSVFFFFFHRMQPLCQGNQAFL